LADSLTKKERKKEVGGRPSKDLYQFLRGGVLFLWVLCFREHAKLKTPRTDLFRAYSRWIESELLQLNFMVGTVFFYESQCKKLPKSVENELWSVNLSWHVECLRAMVYLW